MKIDEALKLSDIVVASCGLCVYRLGNTDWYYHEKEARSIYDLAGMYASTTPWQPAYVRPQFQIGENVSFLQACLSGQCFVVRDRGDNIRRCVDIVSGKIEWYRTAESDWHLTTLGFNPSDTATIVADPSQEQPKTEKRQRTYDEIVADIKTLVEELEDVK